MVTSDEDASIGSEDIIEDEEVSIGAEDEASIGSDEDMEESSAEDSMDDEESCAITGSASTAAMAVVANRVRIMVISRVFNPRVGHAARRRTWLGWVPLASLLNNLNRAVGQHDAYPFVLTPPVIGKLGFIQRLVHDAGRTQWTVPGPSGPSPINRPW